MISISDKIKRAIENNSEFEFLSNFKRNLFRKDLTEKEINIILDLYNLHRKDQDNFTAKYITLYNFFNVYTEAYNKARSR